MTRVPITSLVIALCCFVAMPAAAAPGDFFELGIIPPDSPNGAIARCENRVAKAAGKLYRDLMKCEVRRAQGRFSDDAAMVTACQEPAAAKFLRTSVSGCTPCLDLAAISTEVRSSVVGGAAGLDGLIYCAASASPCTHAGKSCACTSEPHLGGVGRCEPDVGGGTLYCTYFGACSAGICAQDSDCVPQGGEPTVCVRPDYVLDGWTCCYARCDY